MTTRNYQQSADNTTQVHFKARVEVPDRVPDRFTSKGKPFAQIQLRELYANGEEADIVKSWNAFDLAGSICKTLNEGAIVKIAGTEKVDQQKGITYYNIKECIIDSNPEPKPVEVVQDERAMFGIDDDLPQKPPRPMEATMLRKHPDDQLDIRAHQTREIIAQLIEGSGVTANSIFGVDSWQDGEAQNFIGKLTAFKVDILESFCNPPQDEDSEPPVR